MSKFVFLNEDKRGDIDNENNAEVIDKVDEEPDQYAYKQSKP